VSERAGHLLVRDLGRAIDPRAADRMVLVVGEADRVAVDDGGRGEHEAADLRRDRGFEDVEGAVHHHFLAIARSFLAQRPAQSGLVKNHVRPVDVRPHRLAIPDVDLDEPRSARRDGPGDVPAVAPQEQIDRNDFLRPRRERGVDDVGPDRSSATGNDDASAGNAGHARCSGSFR
jgi:hypothetical protein